MRPLKTSREVAEELGISVRHLRTMVRRGLFPPPIRIGRRILRWDAEVLDGWLTEVARGCGPGEADAQATPDAGAQQIGRPADRRQ